MELIGLVLNWEYFCLFLYSRQYFLISSQQLEKKVADANQSRLPVPKNKHVPLMNR